MSKAQVIWEESMTAKRQTKTAEPEAKEATNDATTTCAVEGCRKHAVTSGLCATHYEAAIGASA